MAKLLNQEKLASEARARAERRELMVGEAKTAYWFYPAEFGAASNLALIMIHGYRGNHHGLEAIAAALPNVDIYIPDLPGFGESSPSKTGHGIDDYAEWLSGFIFGLNLKREPHLLGHSFGSIIVSAFASRFSGIKSLILENPVSAPALSGPRALATAATKSFFWLAGALPESLGLKMLKGKPMVRGMSVVMTKSRDRELRKWIHAQHDNNFSDFASRAVALDGYSASISNCVADFSANFKLPVLMLIGELDDITTVKQQRALFSSIGQSNSKLVEFKRVGHLTHYEIPEEIAKSVEEWLAEHDD
jgi:pimeloyl-ACP methyl ester carboxylesterase